MSSPNCKKHSNSPNSVSDRGFSIFLLASTKHTRRPNPCDLSWSPAVVSHFWALRIAKSTESIGFFALVSSPNCKKQSTYKLFGTLSSPNCKKHSKYNLFCTFELSELRKAQQISAVLHFWALRIAKSTVNISYFALFISLSCKTKHRKYKLFCTC